MSEHPYMQLYVADYLGDTQHLTTEQHGAYLLLLMTMWRQGGALPNDPKKLARISRVSPRRWHLISAEVMGFFQIDGDFVVQKRLERELKKARSISEIRSANGKRGGDAKSLKKQEPCVASATVLPVDTRAVLPPPIPVSPPIPPSGGAITPFDQFWKNWDGKHDNVTEAEAVWATLSEPDRKAAVADAKPYFAEQRAKNHGLLTAKKYLLQRRWKGPQQAATLAAKPPPEIVKIWPGTKQWKAWQDHLAVLREQYPKEQVVIEVIQNMKDAAAIGNSVNFKTEWPAGPKATA